MARRYMSVSQGQQHEFTYSGTGTNKMGAPTTWRWGGVTTRPERIGKLIHGEQSKQGFYYILFSLLLSKSGNPR